MSTQTTEETALAAQDAGLVRRQLQRVVLPEERDLDVLPLYVDYSAAGGVASGIDDQSSSVTVDMLSQARHPENILDRRRLRVLRDQRVSFGTYFNGFAASYWRMWSIVDTVLLRVRVTGSATVIVYRSTADGRSQRVDSVSTEAEASGEFEFALPLKPFGDGGVGDVVDFTVGHSTDGIGSDSVGLTATLSVVPEPASVALVLVGLVAMSVAHGRRSRAPRR